MKYTSDKSGYIYSSMLRFDILGTFYLPVFDLQQYVGYKSHQPWQECCHFLRPLHFNDVFINYDLKLGSFLLILHI